MWTHLEHFRNSPVDRKATLKTVVILSFTYLGYRLVSYCRRRARLYAAVRIRKNEQELNFEKITKYYEQLSKEEADKILAWSYEELKENLQTGRVTCVNTLQAYQRKAMEVTKRTNCVCLFIEEAITRAEDYDRKAKDPNYKKPPLFGVPVSVKECTAVKDMDCTLGYVQDLFKSAKDDSAPVKSIKQLGAVPFVHTNNPTSLLTWATNNAIYGRTVHPRDSFRTPGGSSGGEGALLADGGSILGIGSDIGGSIRIPATFCGLAGFKPTVGRFSHIFSPGGVPGRCKIIATEGPMAKNINTCIDMLRLTWSDPYLFNIDPYVSPVYWNEELFSSKKPLKIGYFTHDGFLTPAPAYVRAVQESISLLKSAGHQIVEFKVPRADEIFRLLLGSVSGDGGYFLNDKLSKDILPSDVDYGFLARHTSPFVQKCLKPLVPWPRLRNLLGVMPSNMQEMRQINADIDTYRREFLKLMLEQEIDALVCPSMVLYAPPHRVPVTIPPAANYTALFNVLDYPAGVVPVTIVTHNDEKRLESYPEKDPYDKLIKKTCGTMKGWPIGVQVAALPYREEVALRVLKEIQDSIGLKE